MKIGLVMEGGANRTIFSMGATDAMLDNGIIADYLIGVSAGIAYGVNYASKQSGRVRKLFDTFVNDKRYMGFKHMLNKENRSYFNLDFIYNEIPNKLLPFDYEELDKFPEEPEAVVTNISTGKPEYLKVTSKDKEFYTLRATCALPLLFPIININGSKYMDGGLSNAIPYERAFEMGCDKVIIIVTRELEYKKHADKFQNLIKHRYKEYPELLKCMKERPMMYNNQREKMFELKKEGKAFVIAPDNTKGFSRTEKDMNKIHSLYKDGYQKVISRLDSLKSFVECN